MSDRQSALETRRGSLAGAGASRALPRRCSSLRAPLASPIPPEDVIPV